MPPAQAGSGLSPDDIKKDGGSCEYIATNFWECKDKDGKVWWCDSTTCQPKPKKVGPLQSVRVNLDLLVMRDKETGEIVVASPLAKAPSKARGKG